MPQNSEGNLSNQKSNEVDLLDYIAILVKYRWMILRNFGVVVGIMIIISLLIPNEYTAVTTLMPPQEQEKFSVPSVLSDVSLPGLSIPMGTTSSDILVQILSSRTVNERILKKEFTYEKNNRPLFEILDYDSVEVGLLDIADYTSFSANDEGIIKVSVTMRGRQLAADVANAYTQELDRVNQEKSVSRAKNSRIYIETQLNETAEDLKLAAEELATFQQNNKAVFLEEQMKSYIEQAAELKGQIIAKEIEIGTMKQTMKTENPLILKAEQELEQLRRPYEEMLYGNFSSDNNNSDQLPFTDVPEVGLRLAELTRELKVQETVWTLLNQQYYQEKIEEARNTPTVQVLDVATPPIRKSWPKRSILVLISGLFSFIISVFWAFGKEYFVRIDKHVDDKNRIDIMVLEIKRDIVKFKSNIKNIFRTIKS